MDALDAALGVSQPIPDIGEILAIQILKVADSPLDGCKFRSLHEDAIFSHCRHLGYASTGFPIIRIHLSSLISQIWVRYVLTNIDQIKSLQSQKKIEKSP